MTSRKKAALLYRRMHQSFRGTGVVVYALALGCFCDLASSGEPALQPLGWLAFSTISIGTCLLFNLLDVRDWKAAEQQAEGGYSK